VGDTNASTDPVEVRFRGADGLDIVADRRGDPAAPPVVLLHGGGQTRHSWAGTAVALAVRGWCTWALDARGHGESDWSPEADYRLSRFAADVAAVADQLGTAPVVVGASLGGLTGLFLEGDLRPGTLRALVLVDVIPRIEKDGADRISAFMAEHMREGFGTLEEAADAIAAYNPHRRRPSDLQGLRKNLRLADDGRWYWHWDPRFITRDDSGTRPPSEIMDQELLTAAAAAVRVPMLLVRGRMSDIVSERGAQAFVAELPHVGYVDVSGAGHMVAGDRNDAFTDAVVRFLEDLPPA
jgi:pimeloyl-ACP methyl ester carboxylesterase